MGVIRMQTMQRQPAARNSKSMPCLAAALLLGAATAASAAAPAVVTITGTVGSSGVALGSTPAYDTSAWLNQPFTLVLQPDISGVVKQSETDPAIPGLVFNYWAPANIRYSLTVGGSSLFAGTDTLFSELSTINDMLVPANIEPPEIAGIVADGTHTYDILQMRFSGIRLSCVGAGGSCADYEFGGVRFGYAWDTAVRQGLTDGNAPDLLSTAFSGGFASASFVIGLARASSGSDFVGNLLALPLVVEGVTVSAVPEPASVAMLLAGLASLGALRARRRP
ncbi:PEP-CTERM sorting domain-containing protein [Aquabacterium sp. OR-4]|uniref:PEP-CTERM sorting domain-containing protein n=1 Tax=Aquabacterium sp. OR-4 TaxID=2978127 RepID=UPI0028C912A3|nr:PEP-CTERM sorting domain-containing protein [Aquabacterium sp. OR-4]MDT7837119.1 PEP-CTERM sorting domain-containing protein [Aquabacterium sp. OR-4]